MVFFNSSFLQWSCMFLNTISWTPFFDMILTCIRSLFLFYELILCLFWNFKYPKLWLYFLHYPLTFRFFKLHYSCFRFLQLITAFVFVTALLINCVSISSVLYWMKSSLFVLTIFQERIYGLSLSAVFFCIWISIGGHL